LLCMLLQVYIGLDDGVGCEGFARLQRLTKFVHDAEGRL